MPAALHQLTRAPAPFDLNGVFDRLVLLIGTLEAFARATPVALEAARYRSAVARPLLRAEAEQIPTMLARHRDTHLFVTGVFMGQAKAAAERGGQTPEELVDAQVASIADVFEVVEPVLSPAGQLALGHALLFIAYEVEEGRRIWTHPGGWDVWAAQMETDRTAWDATADRVGALLCLAAAAEITSPNTQVCDALAWSAWVSCRAMWQVIERSRRELMIRDATFRPPDIEPEWIDYLDARSIDEFVDWADDDADLDVFTAPDGDR